jgi:sugar phosphate isomerase/epimerase
MKLSFSTLGNPDWSFERTLEEAEKLGFNAIEIRGIEGKMMPDEIYQFFLENQVSTKAQLLKHNLKICGFGTSVNFHDFDKYEDMIKQGKSAIDVCVDMEIPFIRVFGDRIVSEDVRDMVIQKVIKGIGELCDYAQGKNVKVLQEVHGNFNTLENVMEVVSALKHKPEFGILWDIAHSDKIYGDDYLKFYNEIKPFIFHVHFKDHLRADGKFELCLVGEGDIPIKDIFNTLKADGYNGYISLEWEKKWHPELPEPETAYPAFMKFMKSL